MDHDTIGHLWSDDTTRKKKSKENLFPGKIIYGGGETLPSNLLKRMVN